MSVVFCRVDGNVPVRSCPPCGIPIESAISLVMLCAVSAACHETRGARVAQMYNYDGATINVQDTSTFVNNGKVSSVIVDVAHTCVVPSLGAPHASLWRVLGQEELRSFEQYMK